ncbi:uncharacterized protein VICG_01003 [Vittaforma corneae ATCC 50505]|uniref:Kinetochore protein SPC25 n=1 Tax=Vittaforma corneae (strain ATCC 50505) TaxID=993615 RepID=L2GMB5_VITCO|nr:uncharacterized protein VICG_01003 [Vittaforma corneae ATCC 50505]ELA41986.1 hypothetical protein VICG_01003 [Vittaforma corneae ATCC 50505]
MDQSEATSKNIRTILNDIWQNLQSKHENLKRDAADLKRKQQDQCRDFSIQNSALLAAFEDSNREAQSLINRKVMLRKSLEKEEADIGKLDKENQEFQRQADELEVLNRSLRERRQDVEEKYKMLLLKSQQLKGKAELKENEHKEMNEAYKRYLGLEIVKIKENVVKISYNNLGSECYMVLDFTNEDCVTGSVPEINIDKLNYLFKEKRNFYEFVKCVRDQLKQRL